MSRVLKSHPEMVAAPRLSDEERFKRAARRASNSAAILRFLMWLTLLVGAVLFMLPLYIMVSMALKTPEEIQQTSLWAWPQQVTWANFNHVLTNKNAPFAAFFRNSTIIATVSTTGVILSSALVAYPFARLKFPGRDRLFLILLGTMMLPGVVTMIPTYVEFKYFRWVDTFYPLTVPAFFGGGAYNIFLLRQFFMGIPRDLDEAALLDGASQATIFWRLVIPNSGPALATVGVFSFIYTWRDMLGPLLYLNSPEKQTLELGLNTYRALLQEQWHYLMAGSVVVMLPLLLLFIVGQRYFVRGIVMSGLK